MNWIGPVGDKLLLQKDSVLDQSLTCLRFHLRPEWGDRNELDVLNRLLAKKIQPDGWTTNTHSTVRFDQISSRVEKWTSKDLGKLRRGHGSTFGEDFECPIIVVEFDGQRLLLDGNHRINRWLEKHDNREHAVNIHTITGDVEMMELPPLRRTL